MKSKKTKYVSVDLDTLEEIVLYYFENTRIYKTVFPNGYENARFKVVAFPIYAVMLFVYTYYFIIKHNIKFFKVKNPQK